MQVSKPILMTFLVFSYSLNALAAEAKYKCTGLAQGRSELQEARVAFEEGFLGGISHAKSTFNVWGRTISKEFRGPVKIPNERASDRNVYLNGADNSRINPFADFDYLRFEGVTEKIKFDDLPNVLSLTIDSEYGPIGNRGTDTFSLNCEKINP